MIPSGLPLNLASAIDLTPGPLSLWERGEQSQRQTRVYSPSGTLLT